MSLLFSIFLFLGAGCRPAQLLFGIDSRCNIDKKVVTKALREHSLQPCLELPEKKEGLRCGWDEDVSTVWPQKECFRDYTQEVDRPKDCELLSYSQGLYGCIDRLARTLSDPTICEPRKNHTDAPLGYNYCLALATRDPEKCMDILEQDQVRPRVHLARTAATCILTVASLKKDYRICLTIDEKTFQELIPGGWQPIRNSCLSHLVQCRPEYRTPSVTKDVLCDLMTPRIFPKEFGEVSEEQKKSYTEVDIKTCLRSKQANDCS